MSKVEFVSLGDLGQIVTGKTPSSESPEDYGGDCLFVTPSDSFQFKHIGSTERTLSAIGVQRLRGKLLPSRSLMVTCIGSDMGKVAMNETAAITNQQINSIIVDSSRFDPDYLYYKLVEYYPLLRQAAGGSTALPLLNKTDFCALRIRVHSVMDEQKRIASVLSALDSKITLNQRINAELEAMAKLLYDYWFVQFDFPDAKGRPYKSSGGRMVYNAALKREVPEGWVCHQLADIVERVGTGLNPRDNFKLGSGENYYVTIANMDYGQVILDSKCDRISDEALSIINRRSDLKVGDILFTSIEPVGRCYLIQEQPKNWNINESVFTIRPSLDKVTPEYLYMLLAGQEMKAYTTNVAAGSIHKGIRHATLKEFKLVYGGPEIIKAFTELVAPMQRRIKLAQDENQELTALRNWLLPLLMNGQVVVGEAEEKVPPSRSATAENGLAMAAEPKAKYQRKPK